MGSWNTTEEENAARRQSTVIREYWQANGFRVETWIETEVLPELRSETTKTFRCVRSDMVAGLPRQAWESIVNRRKSS